METVYLAGPFENIEFEVAVNLHRKAAAWLVEKGYSVFSPLMNAVPVWLETKEKVSEPWWEALEERFIKAVDVLVMITVPETIISAGCQREIKMAQRAKKPIGLLVVTDKGFELHFNQLKEPKDAD